MDYLRKKRDFLLQLAVLAVFAACYLLFAPNYRWQSEFESTPYGADFLQEWVAARLIVSGRADEIYSESFSVVQHDQATVGFTWDINEYFPPVYPPSHYLLFAPLGLIPYRWATILWLGILFASVWGSIRIIQTLIQEHSRESKTTAHRVAWIALLLFPSLLFSITLGQKSPVWLLIVSLTALLLARNRSFRAGVAFGFLSIKPTLFFLIPLVMLKQKRWSFLAGAIFSASIVWGAALLVMPASAWVGFASGLKSVGSFAEHGGYRVDWSCNLMSIAYSMPPDLVQWTKWSICLPITIYLFYTLVVSNQICNTPNYWMMVLASTALLSPHFYHYDLCVMLLPILWFSFESMRRAVSMFALLAVGVSLAPDVQEYLRVPILPLILLGIVAELSLRERLFWPSMVGWRPGSLEPHRT